MTTLELKIKIRDNLHLSSILESDKAALLKHLDSKEIYNTTLNIPSPYLVADADFWIRKRIEHTRKQGKEVTFAIRDDDAGLIGVIGADGYEFGLNHRAEFGYWLARPYWGKGIMTDAVKAYVHYAFTELELLRLTAHVFAFNPASARVLEKNGFKLEGHLRKHFCKDGNLIDAHLYGLLKEDLL